MEEDKTNTDHFHEYVYMPNILVMQQVAKI